MEYKVWDRVGAELRDFKYKKKYVTPERYLDESPLDNLVAPPDFPDFFGTKVCNIFIVGIPYGWTKGGDGIWSENWPPVRYEEYKAAHIENFKKYTWYETHVYIDMNLVDLVMEDSPSSRFREMMESTKSRLQTMCDELADYGFIMEEDLTTEVDASFFQDTIDLFNQLSA